MSTWNTWLPTFPLANRWPSSNDASSWPDYSGWSIPELLRGERFAQSAPNEPVAPTSPAGASTEAALVTSRPHWLTTAERQVTPQDGSWPAPPPTLPYSPPVGDDPFERAAFRLRRPTPRQSPMGPPFLNEAPANYPSHLGPIPKGPSWPEVVPHGPTPWSPLAQPPRATDWGRTLTGTECRRNESGKYDCITPGGLRYNNVPVSSDFPDRIGPGEPDYHQYNVTQLGGYHEPAPDIVQGPTPGPRWQVRPATEEGTRNPAAPLYIQFPQFAANHIPGMKRLLGSPWWPVTSYKVTDQFGRPAVINVSHPSHIGPRGIVIRSQERLPSGRYQIRNQGAGVAWSQSPDQPRVFTDPRDWFTDYLWRDQSQDNIDSAERRNSPPGTSGGW